MFNDAQIKLIMITNYENQLDMLFTKFNQGEFSTLEFTKKINYLNHRCSYTRVDIKNFGKDNSVKFFEYDKNINMSTPTWLKDEFGQGCKLEWSQKNTYFIVQCLNEGNLKIILRGIDFRDITEFRTPIYTNFTKLTINNEIIFDDNHLIWHNSPYIFEKDCNDGQYFYISLEFKTLFDYFPYLISQKFISDNIEESFEKIKKFINLEKSLLHEQLGSGDFIE